MNTNRNRSSAKAFTMVEMLVAIAVSIVVTLALYAVFDQIQKAFRTTIAQTDVMEGGRAAMELLSTELAELRASDLTNGWNLYSLAEPEVFLTETGQGNQEADRGMRVLREFFFLRRSEGKWQGIGYWIEGASNGIGKLHRYEAGTLQAAQLRSQKQIRGMLDEFNSVKRRSESDVVLPGVVHLNVTPYNSNGVPYRAMGERTLEDGDTLMQPASEGPVYKFGFTDKALPAYIDLEIGVLERRALEEMRNFPTASMRQQYLERQSGKVHLFRQRIPIRTAQP